MMLGSPCSPCCAQPMFAALTMAGWRNHLHAYNLSSSWNTVDPIVPSTYADAVPYAYAPIATFNHRFVGTRIQGFAPFTVGARSGAATITFLPNTVTLSVTLSVGIFNQLSSLTCTAVYEKTRSEFWQDKFESGIFFFTAGDLVSFTSNSGLLVEADVGTTVVVQRPFLPDGSVAWQKPLALPLRFHITDGLPEYSFPEDFAQLRPTQSGNETVSLLYQPSLGLFVFDVIRGFDELNFAGTEVPARWTISAQYWEAFSDNGVLTVSGIGVTNSVFPGTTEWEIPVGFPYTFPPVQSTLVVTKL